MRIRGTKTVFEIAFVACMGEPGHREVRYYPKGDLSEWKGYWWYAEDLELVLSKEEGWGGQNPEPKKRKRRWRQKRENG